MRGELEPHGRVVQPRLRSRHHTLEAPAAVDTTSPVAAELAVSTATLGGGATETMMSTPREAINASLVDFLASHSVLHPLGGPFVFAEEVISDSDREGKSAPEPPSGVEGESAAMILRPQKRKESQHTEAPYEALQLEAGVLGVHHASGFL